MPETLDFHFDFISPYAYLAWPEARRIAEERGLTLVPRPTLLGAVLAHWGQLGPAEIPPKRVFTFKDILRRAADQKMPLTAPATHPFKSVTALRASMNMVAGERQLDVITAFFDAAWGRGEEIGDPESAAVALTKAGLDGATLIQRTLRPEVKAALRAAMDEAIAAGVFGVPTFIVRGELFFGQDRASDVRRFLDGKDPVDPNRLKLMNDRIASATRKR
jgi:2-hydroxychromene-2-carboxylate isomerase